MSALPSRFGLRPLRPYQADAFTRLRESLRSGHRRPMCMAPTGAGKTLLAAHIIDSALGKGKRVLFVVPMLSLIDQTVAAFEGEGLMSIGVIQGAHPRVDPCAQVQVCSIQTLARRAMKPEADLVMIDEAHLRFEALSKWIHDPAWAKIPFIGLSATPGSAGLGLDFDDLITVSTTADLIAAGFLSPFKVFCPSEPDLSNVRTLAGDFHDGDLSAAVDQPKIVGDVIKEWQKHAAGLPSFCFAIDCQHAEHLQQRFVEAGVAAEFVNAHTERADREEMFARFRSGETKVICNVGVLTAGIDLDVRCLLDARPTKSEMRFVQTIGRVLRTAPGKSHALILDFAGNHQRLGLVTEIAFDALDDGKSGKAARKPDKPKEKLPRVCDQCKALIPAGATRCVECGAIQVAKSGVIVGDGSLVEFGQRASGKKHAATIEEKARFMGELSGYAVEKGFKPGFAIHKYRERFGVWPNDPRVRYAPTVAPSLDTKRWIRSRFIANAKGRDTAVAHA